MLAIYGTVIDYVTRRSHTAPQNTLNRFALHFSLTQNHAKLFTLKATNSGRIGAMDMTRLTVIVSGVAGHCLSCLETIPGWYLIARLHDLRHRFSQIWAQPMLNEGGLGLVTFVGGFATFWATHDLISKGRFRYRMAIFERWLRYMPSLMSMVAIDLLWPLSGDGPMMTYVSKHLVDKCSNYAWMNFLFLNNFNSAPDNVRDCRREQTTDCGRV